MKHIDTKISLRDIQDLILLSMGLLPVVYHIDALYYIICAVILLSGLAYLWIAIKRFKGNDGIYGQKNTINELKTIVLLVYGLIISYSMSWNNFTYIWIFLLVIELTYISLPAPKQNN